jgi:hypothetical protein
MKYLVFGSFLNQIDSVIEIELKFRERSRNYDFKNANQIPILLLHRDRVRSLKQEESQLQRAVINAIMSVTKAC